MATLYHKIKFICAALAALLLVACTDDSREPGAESQGRTVCPVIRFSVSDMEMSAVGRASAPMSPDLEKYVRTLAVFEFDNEGLHIKSSTTYHFIDFVKGTVDGETSPDDQVEETEHGVVEATLQGISFESYTDGTLCLVANVTEDQVRDFYATYKDEGQSYGNITFDQFKRWNLPFDYMSVDGVDYDESVSGYVETMYMFGYYEGKIDASVPEEISVDLGRLASRLDITVVNETGRELDRRLGYHFDDVCHSAYFFPIKMSRPPTYGIGLSRTIICTGIDDPVDGVDYLPETFPDKGTHTHYFYVAAHSAVDENEATKLHLFYNSRVLGNDEVDPEGSSIKIPLCNVVPSEAASVPNGYSLSRNTRYHFTIRLRGGNTQVASPYSVATTDVPGELIVYLPLD